MHTSQAGAPNSAYLPAAQASQILPFSAKIVPGLHPKQLVLSSDDTFPSGQLSHTSVDPRLNLPAAQFSQTVPLSTAFLYFPGPHDEHVDEPTLLNPVPQLVHLSDAPVLNSFAGHGSSPVWRVFDFCPAFTVVQYEAPAEE